jgi:hypothetical protein
MFSLIFATLLLMVLYTVLRLHPMDRVFTSGRGYSAQFSLQPTRWRGAAYARLLYLLSGNARVADRLIQDRRQDSPARSEAWAIDQVIFDLLQDGF